MMRDTAPPGIVRCPQLSPYFVLTCLSRSYFGSDRERAEIVTMMRTAGATA
jgi:hypothetical protein